MICVMYATTNQRTYNERTTAAVIQRYAGRWSGAPQSLINMLLRSIWSTAAEGGSRRRKNGSIDRIHYHPIKRLNTQTLIMGRDQWSHQVCTNVYLMKIGKEVLHIVVGQIMSNNFSLWLCESNGKILLIAAKKSNSPRIISLQWISPQDQQQTITAMQWKAAVNSLHRGRLCWSVARRPATIPSIANTLSAEF